MNYRSKPENMNNQAQNPFRFNVRVLFAGFIMMLFMFGCATSPPLDKKMEVSSDQVDRPLQEAVEAQLPDIEPNRVEAVGEDNARVPSPPESGPSSGGTFPTFKDTGIEICTNDEGRPRIYLFSSSTCIHCKWAGGIFDFIAKYYMADGLIEAHHYDVMTGDDLLTEENESVIPTEALEIKHRGDPEGLVPYYNFGCVYDRIGNGYEKEGDLSAEGEEMRRVIEALVKIVSEGN